MPEKSEKGDERRRRAERAQQENLRKQRLIEHGKKKIAERGLPGGPLSSRVKRRRDS